MFLHNFWEMMRAMYIEGEVNNGLNDGKFTPVIINTIKWLSWTSSSTALPYFYGPRGIPNNGFGYDNVKQNMTVMTNPYKWNGVLVGTGTAPVSADDYKLENNVTSSFSQVTTTQTVQYSEDNTLRMTITWTGTNTTSDAITISEIGLMHYMWLSSSNTYNYLDLWRLRMEVLCVRHLLGEPVTIEPGATKSIILTMELF